MKIISLLIVFFLLLSSSVWALQPAVIGGVRGGLAVGLMADENMNKNVGIRFGAEAATGSRPLILFFGGKFHLQNISGRYPMAFGLGLVGKFGNNNSDAGVSVSLIFDRPFDVEPLFFEAGVDVAGSGGIQLQAGYKF
ncbi:hypothetical protein A2276_02635 [candidate division WOR-1 bacterium RIFOXYA12_FULL_43_27]|uniref:Outer membrane protein beta-barrel domain-containing protein n=1 Tax=candidate division WOR-1 bacterium RIFOXYC2_FULL_46_14 TaxID=1802587 RepID=A0A1F4U807_UNCSA|nr:MAG: hypothetical protein A2276_02635 [candidate division WOR-1 bacterium RIFOXYA12_FULL_43_27]OGC19391.1 MAG: hypothetical protein A2292_01695 [candidate division WOR-1 bacterium RIFOXYB2_FULL_46_45]OGC30380.1 MAG: hypothetical protein A2232_01695 [candidate division WOR-1 bacterium RIFOXYA2_FULL_46_56]OGC40980.1 MAG: hypothetical protein A2438_01695 [candidate division WOR-1 bacterium RIFOXYC2_FULL_46_14]